LADAPVLGNEPVARGVYVGIDRRVALKDAAFTKATMSRQQVQKAVGALHDAAQEASKEAAASQAARQVTDTPVAKDEDGRDAEPPPDAVKWYLQGRQRFLEGSNSQAITALEKALALDPKAFTVLRLMGGCVLPTRSCRAGRCTCSGRGRCGRRMSR